MTVVLHNTVCPLFTDNIPACFPLKYQAVVYDNKENRAEELSMQSKIITPFNRNKQGTYGQAEEARYEALLSFRKYAGPSLTTIDELLFDTITNKNQAPSNQVLTVIKDFNELLLQWETAELFGAQRPGTYVDKFCEQLNILKEKYLHWFNYMKFDADINTLYACIERLGGSVLPQEGLAPDRKDTAPVKKAPSERKDTKKQFQGSGTTREDGAENKKTNFLGKLLKR